MLSMDKLILSSDLQDFFPQKYCISIRKNLPTELLQEIGIFILKCSSLLPQ